MPEGFPVRHRSRGSRDLLVMRCYNGPALRTGRYVLHLQGLSVAVPVSDPKGGMHQHFPHVEQLGDVVIRADLKTNNPVNDIILSGHHDDRHMAFPSHAFGNLEPVVIAQLNV